VATRSITNEEIGLIKAMLRQGIKNKDIQFYFNRPDRAVNSSRITGIRVGTYGPEAAEATEAKLNEFRQTFEPNQLVPVAGGLLAGSGPPKIATDADRIKALLVQDDNELFKLSEHETHKIEWKCESSSSKLGKIIQTIAAMANNGGGVILFGIDNKLRTVTGLADNKFAEFDPQKITQKVKSLLQPTPMFRKGTVTIADKVVGYLIVEKCPYKPVISCKDSDDIEEGLIYFRYPGETCRIKFMDLMRLLDERDRRARETLRPMVERLFEIGPKEAMIANLSDGVLEGSERPILIDEKLLARIKFIKEGEFYEKSGAETLKLIGEVGLSSTATIVKSVVREEVSEDSILRNFIQRSSVQEPLSYFRTISHEAARTYPIWFYLQQAGISRKAAIAELTKHKTAKPKSRYDMIRQLTGKKSFYSKAGGENLVRLGNVRCSDELDLSTPLSGKAYANSFAGLQASDLTIVDRLHNILKSIYDLWEANAENWTCNGLVPVTCLSLCHLSFKSQGAYAAQI
jgi:Putative DNA-binding domain